MCSTFSARRIELMSRLYLPSFAVYARDEKQSIQQRWRSPQYLIASEGPFVICFVPKLRRQGTCCACWLERRHCNTFRRPVADERWLSFWEIHHQLSSTERKYKALREEEYCKHRTNEVSISRGLLKEKRTMTRRMLEQNSLSESEKVVQRESFLSSAILDTKHGLPL